MLSLKLWFIIFHFLTIFLVIFFLFCINTVYCLISLVGIILCASIFLLISNCEFFALVYLLIYVGAIVVFFLFTIMLLHLRFDRVFDFDVSHALAIPCFLSLNALLCYFIVSDFSYLELHRNDNLWNSYYKVKVRGDFFEKYIINREFDSDNLIYNAKFQMIDSSIANYKIIGFTMYSQFGYLCFLVGFILLFTMVGIMQVIKLAREEVAVASSR